MQKWNRLRAWIAMVGGFAITLVYILRALWAALRLSEAQLSVAAVYLPMRWSRVCTGWLYWMLGTSTRVYGMTDGLAQRMRTGRVFALGPHVSMGELLQWSDFFISIGHKMAVVCKIELKSTPLGRAMDALGLAWFIDRAGGSAAVRAIKHYIDRATTLVTAVIFSDGTKATPERIQKGQNNLHKQAQGSGVYAVSCARLLSSFECTGVPSSGGTAALIDAARVCENAVVLFVTTRSPRHVATPTPANVIIGESWWLYRLYLGFNPRGQRWLNKLVEAWAFVVDLVDQTEALTGKSVEIFVDELDINTEKDHLCGCSDPREIQLNVVPNTHDRERFKRWLLLRFAHANSVIAEVSNTVSVGSNPDLRT